MVIDTSTPHCFSGYVIFKMAVFPDLLGGKSDFEQIAVCAEQVHFLQEFLTHKDPLEPSDEMYDAEVKLEYYRDRLDLLKARYKHVFRY